MLKTPGRSSQKAQSLRRTVQEPDFGTPGTDKGRAPGRAAVDCPITTSGGAPLIVDGLRRVRRSTFTEGAIMERAEYNRHSRARVAETTKGASRHATPCNAGRAGAHRPSEALHPTRSSDVLTRIARERVPTAPQVRKRVDRGPAREPPQDARC